MSGGDAGQAASKACPQCAHPAEPEARYCSRCGAPLTRDASLPGEPPPAEPGVSLSGARPAPAQASPSRAGADPLIGRVVAERYRILSLAGRGGMGVVYRVEHIRIGKLMAMKLLSGQLSRDAATVRRFRSEAKAISKLGHPNTVQVFDFGESARLVYLVMEYVPGRDLGALIQDEGPLEARRALRIAAQVAASVAEAHERGIVHRDIKPENIMVCDTARQHDFVKVLDFGIAKLRDVEEPVGATAAGNIVGTPYYMAPEQIRADEVDQRTDVYALGAVLYKALSGVPPYQSGTSMGVLTMHLTQPLTPLRERTPKRDLPLQVEAIVNKALEKKPEHRFQSMDEFREAMEACLTQMGDAVPVGARSVPTMGVELATRDDVDRYARRIRRTHRFGLVLMLCAVLAIGYALYLAYGQRNAWSPPVTELEPNDEPSLANVLTPGRPLNAHIGTRLSATYGDVDLYRFDVPLASTRVVDLRVTALRNIDLVLELVRKGDSRPLLTVDSAGVGEPESIPNLTLRGGNYFVRVRERFESVRWPTENVSDNYRISLRFLDPELSGETELNDGFEVAEALTPGMRRTGYIGWRGDRDVYCFAAQASPHVVVLSGGGALDLVLKLIDRDSRSAREQNALPAGAGERLEVPVARAFQRPCVEVRAHEHEGAPRADPDEPYTLELVPRGSVR